MLRWGRSALAAAGLRPRPSLALGSSDADPTVNLHADPEAAIGYLAAEAAWTEAAVMNPLASEVDALAAGMLRKLPPDSAVPPERVGEYLVAVTLPPGAEYPVVSRTPAAAPESAPQLVLDLNTLFDTFATSTLQFGDVKLSPDGARVAHALDVGGAGSMHVYVKDLATGAYLDAAGWSQPPGAPPAPVTPDPISALEWDADSRGLIVVSDAGDAVGMVGVGRDRAPSSTHWFLSAPADSQLLSEPAHFDLGTTSRRSYLAAGLFGASSSCLWIARSSPGKPTPPEAFKLVREPVPSTKYFAAEWGADTEPDARLALIVSSPAWPNYAIVDAATDELLLPHDPSFAIEDADVVGNVAVVLGRELDSGLPGLRLLRLPPDAPLGSVPLAPSLPSELSSFVPGANWQPPRGTPSAPPSYRLVGDSPIHHESPVDVKLSGAGFGRIAASAVAPAVAATVERLAVPSSRDAGVSIPVTVVKPADAPNGPMPFLTFVYGAYGMSLPETYDERWLPMIERGVGLAYIHVRGGSELGPEWHARGAREYKANSISDYVDCLEHLQSTGLADPSRTGALALSAGAIVVANVILNAPHLLSAAVLDVPFVDVLGALDAHRGVAAARGLEAADLAEYGDPRSDAMLRKTIEAYCPHAQLLALWRHARDAGKADAGGANRPRLLVRAAVNDDRVLPASVAAFTALYRSTFPDAELAVEVEDDVGHFGDAGKMGVASIKAHELCSK
ncbi:protease II [Thecamonas trahens ATCC 50062]|uniref:Prolyl endopeptidase n=1 Tax=Thecamonas trahens ATCC 50062 TaxID=461836 RepID=A0A0L0DPN0_THETB|nr:protease II [Thecamonas trahens ATCC 50062]KNC54210.1 protease II [Thecamonas trahens ATCC 50062]|eukprot:XP_013753850.1 protease II [Thecamonas trahens ATCC 50062]